MVLNDFKVGQFEMNRLLPSKIYDLTSREHHKSQYRCQKDLYLDKSNVDKVQVVCLSQTAFGLMQLGIYPHLH